MYRIFDILQNYNVHIMQEEQNRAKICLHEFLVKNLYLNLLEYFSWIWNLSFTLDTKLMIQKNTK